MYLPTTPATSLAVMPPLRQARGMFRPFVALALSVALCGNAPQPDKRSAVRDADTGLHTLALPATKIMVLGIGHLDGAPANFETAWLEPVLCRLRSFSPDVILTEAMPGEQVMMLESYSGYHGDAGKYGGPTLTMARAAQAELKLSAGEALVKADALAAAHPATASERRRLAALFVAAAEPFSATVQWLRLPAVERIAGDGVTPDLAKRLDRFAGLRSEMTSLAARGAADRGLERLYGAGDHASDVVLPDDAVFRAAVAASPGQKEQFAHDTAAFRAVPQETMKLASADEVMPVMRWKNSARFGELDADSQWFSMLRSASMGRVGRQRVAAWEAQNLHMATIIREATAAIPGGRALLIVGAAHKPFVERYLRTFGDVEIASSSDLLASVPAGCAA